MINSEFRFLKRTGVGGIENTRVGFGLTQGRWLQYCKTGVGALVFGG